MRIGSILVAAVLALVAAGCKSEPPTPPNPTTIINNVRGQLAPFRLAFATDPASPNYNTPVTLKVHVIDEAGHPADGAVVQANVSMSGMDHGRQQIALQGTGNGDYGGRVELEMAGSWDVDLSVSKDGKTGQQKFSIEVGG